MRGPGDHNMIVAMLVTGAMVTVALLVAISAPAANLTPATHLGVASCAGTTCHGRSLPDGKIVRQDEILRWQEPSSAGGAHSRAFAVLRSARGEQIAHRLGLGDAASAPSCIGCHADNAASRGPTFQINDGVGCEACHGGARGWIESHRVVGATHAGNVVHGMTALENPLVRANNCLDCHYGSAKAGQFVTHKIMAAGHPRISFELDLFSALQAHHNEDADYIARKGRPSSMRFWAVGQAMAIERSLSLFMSPQHGTEGAFPEFTFFDCHSCHRRIQDNLSFNPTAVDNPARPIPPGTPPYNDENMIMLSAAAKVAAPELGRRFDTDARAFHAAIARDRPSALAAAARLRGGTDALARAFAATDFSRKQMFDILDTISGEAISPRFTDYTGSAQSVMAVDTLLNALVKDGAVSPEIAASARPAINQAYAAVRDPNDYRPAAFRAALGSAVQSIRGLR